MRPDSMCENTAKKGTIADSKSKLAFGMVIPDRIPLRRTKSNGRSPQGSLFENRSAKRVNQPPTLPVEDNTPEGLRALLKANAHYLEVPWPEPYHYTRHYLRKGDARDLSWIADASVHLVVTSPPYWTLKEYSPGNDDQMGHFQDYEH